MSNAPQPPVLNPGTSPARPSASGPRHATSLKLLIIAVLALALGIPLILVYGVLHERLSRRDAAIAEMTNSWGREQQIVGPVLILPYRYQTRAWRDATVDGKAQRVETVTTNTALAYFLPSRFSVDGQLDSQERHRGIYKAVVYSGALKLAGTFAPPDLESLKIAADQVQWEDARVALAISDLRGARGALELKWGGAAHLFHPGTQLPEFPSGVSARLAGQGPITQPTEFAVDVTLNGSRGIGFAPVGTTNSVQLKSSWPDPSFRGAFLPVQREVDAAGFSAAWEMSHYGRDYPQQWTDRNGASPFTTAAVTPSLFGVDFLTLVDAYRNVERSIKYGILFVVLVFATFFLFEVRSGLRIHPFQYILVGAALCLFFLLLLSVSEFVRFPAAYAAAAGATTLLITLYSLAVLRSGARTLLVAVGMAASFGFLYVILQLQDHALLFGSLGLFAALSAVMWATRRIDWYARDAG